MQSSMFLIKKKLKVLSKQDRVGVVGVPQIKVQNLDSGDSTDQEKTIRLTLMKQIGSGSRQKNNHSVANHHSSTSFDTIDVTKLHYNKSRQ